MILRDMRKDVKIGSSIVGDGHQTYIIGEIGINHNGDMEIVKKLIDLAVIAGINAVKFQKREPELAVPKSQWDKERDTPWGRMRYIDYKKKIELGEDDYKEIDSYCQSKGIEWFASVWDENSVDFMESLKTVAYKLPSASLTDIELIDKARKTGTPLIISTGMSTMEELEKAVETIGGTDNLIIMQSTSTYPAKTDELNLRVIETYRKRFDCPIGYSGHELEIIPTVAAVAMGANIIERHITLDREMWGTDQKASVDPVNLIQLERYIRMVEAARGDGTKKVYESEIPIREKLRRKK
jgi:N-acetylneuraminate synthase